MQKRNDKEHQEQAALFKWAKMLEGAYPELSLLHAVINHNILFSTLSKESFFKVLSYLRAEGFKDGVLDVHLPVARGEWHSLWVEMKVGDNKPTPEQVIWLDALIEQGNYATVCYSAEEAIGVISSYLEGSL